MTNQSNRANQYEALLSTEHLQSDLRAKAIKGAGYTFSGQTIGYAIQTIGTIVLARLLSPEDFGLVAMVSAFSLLIQNFGFNGFIEAVVQREEITHDQMSKLFWVNLAIMSGLTLAFMALAPVIAWFYKEPQLRKMTLVISSSILFNGLTTCHFAVLTRNMKFHLTALIQLLAGVLSTVIAVLTALKGIGYWALVLRRISLPMLTAVLAWLMCHWRPGIPAKNTEIKPIIKFGLNTYGYFLMDYLRKNTDKVIIGKLFGKSPLGNYDRAGYLSAVLPTQLTYSLSGVGVATLSRLKNDTEKYLAYFSKSLSLIAFVAFPGSVFFTLVGKDFIVILLGPQWGAAGDFFTALGPAIGLVVIYDMNNWLHLSLGRPDRLLKWTIFVFIAALLAFFIGAIFGPMGVAIAYSVLFYLLLLPALYYAGRPLKIRASYYLSILWKYWAAAFLAGGAYWVFVNALKPVSHFYHHSGAFIRISFGSFLYAFIYLGLIIVFFKGLAPLSLLVSTLKGIVRR